MAKFGVLFWEPSNVVKEVQVGSLAESLGVLPGDVISEVIPGGTVVTALDLPRIMRNVEPGQLESVKVERSGESLILRIDATTQYKTQPLANRVSRRSIDEIVRGMWIWILCQGIGVGIWAGAAFSERKCDEWDVCSSSFAWGSLFTWGFGAVVAFGPLAFVVRAQREVVNAIEQLEPRVKDL